MDSLPITIKEALQIMEKTGDLKRPVPFSLEWVTADRVRNTGGIIKKAEGVTLLKNERAVPQRIRQAKTKQHNANRILNATRDIFYNGRPDRVHIFLILKINGKPVV